MTRVALAVALVALASSCTPIVTLGTVPDAGPPVDTSPGCGALAVRLTNGTCTVWGWNGSATRGDCVPMAGCDCVGPDCGRLRPTREECLAINTSCWNATCSLADPTACPMNFYCAHDDCSGLGTCRPVPTDCAAEPVSTVCGCSNMAYVSACRAHQAFEDVSAHLTCGVCNGLDASGVGSCMDVLGWRWDGAACTPVVGCACVGTQCLLLAPTQADCEGQYLMRCSAVFPCTSFSCIRGQEACAIFASGPTPARCSPFPMGCLPSPSCGCVTDWGGMCSDDGTGAITVYLP